MLQYITEIDRKSKEISICVVYFVSTDTLGIPNLEEKLKNRGYKPIEKNNEYVKKIEKKDYACLEFLCEEGGTVAVHEKN